MKNKLIKQEKRAQKNSNAIEKYPHFLIFSALSTSRNKGLLMPEERRLYFLGLSKEEKEDKLGKDKADYLNFVIEKMRMLEDKEDAREEYLQKKGLGESGKNIPAQMEDLLNEHPNASEDILVHLRSYDDLDEFLDVKANQTDIALGAVGEIIEIIQSESENYKKMQEKKAELQKEIDGLIEDKRLKEEEISQTDKKADADNENLKKLEMRAAEVEKGKNEAEKAVQKFLQDIRDAELKKAIIEGEVKGLEARKEGAAKDIAILEGRMKITDMPKEIPKDIPKESILKGNISSEKVDNASTESKPIFTKEGVYLLCRNPKCPNSSPSPTGTSKWLYKGMRDETNCPKCGKSKRTGLDKNGKPKVQS